MTDHEKRSDGKAAYTAFKVSVKSKNSVWEVFRRYSEFHSLNAELQVCVLLLEHPGVECRSRTAVLCYATAVFGRCRNNCRACRCRSCQARSWWARWFRGSCCCTMVLPAKLSPMLCGPRVNSFVEKRRAKLDAYIGQLVRLPAVWSCDVLVRFLDNRNQELAQAVNLSRLLARTVSHFFTWRVLCSPSVTLVLKHCHRARCKRSPTHEPNSANAFARSCLYVS